MNGLVALTFCGALSFCAKERPSADVAENERRSGQGKVCKRNLIEKVFFESLRLHVVLRAKTPAVPGRKWLVIFVIRFRASTNQRCLDLLKA